MHPILFKFNWLGQEIFIGTYWLMILIGCTAGILLGLWRAKLYHISAEFGFYFQILTIVIGLFFAGLVHFILFYGQSEHYSPGFVSWGGILGGILAFFWIRKLYPISISSIANFAAPSFSFGLGVGRIGCFFGGCCFGKPIQSWPDFLPVFKMGNQLLIPTQLISAVFLFLLGFLLLFIERTSFQKYTSAFFLILYGIFRFSIEFFRDDPRIFYLELSDGQFFSIISVLSGVLLLFLTGKKSRN